MKLCRFGPAGREKPGLIDADGRLRDLSGAIEDIDAAALAPDRLASLAALDPATLPLIEDSPRYGVPVAGTRKFIAIGLNYADHAAESNLPIPSEPVVFNKWVSCLQGPNDDVVIPRDATSALDPFDLAASLRQTTSLLAGRVTDAAGITLTPPE